MKPTVTDLAEALRSSRPKGRTLRPDDCDVCPTTRGLAANARAMGKPWEVVACACKKVYPCPPRAGVARLDS